MRSSLFTRVGLAVLILTAAVALSSCRSVPRQSVAPAVADASVTAPEGTPVLSLHVAPIAASVRESFTATVTYTNVSTGTVNVRAPGGAFYNVRVTSSDGTVAFDSWPYPKNAKLPMTLRSMAPGASLSGSVGFQLKEPGRYAVVAYLNGLETPPVTVTVSP